MGRLKLKSARELVIENEAARNRQFREDYPDGKYILKRITSRYGKKCPPEYRMRRVLGRGHLATCRGSTTVDMVGDNMRTYRNTGYSFSGPSFNSLDSCLAAAGKRGFPDGLIRAFAEAVTEYKAGHRKTISA